MVENLSTHIRDMILESVQVSLLIFNETALRKSVRDSAEDPVVILNYIYT